MKRFTVLITLFALLAGASAASAAGGLSGTFKTKIGGSGRLAGHWTIKFSHGNYKVTDNGTAVVRGKYTVSGSKLTMSDTGGPASCRPTGHYTFARSGSKLKFMNTGDRSATCAGRAAVLSHTFTKA
jgi:hypothetical protein